MPDNRVQCCLYFIAPSGHGFVFYVFILSYLRQISRFVNLSSRLDFLNGLQIMLNFKDEFTLACQTLASQTPENVIAH